MFRIIKKSIAMIVPPPSLISVQAGGREEILKEEIFQFQ